MIRREEEGREIDLFVQELKRKNTKDVSFYNIT
jgi:hypothetical protein